MSILETAIMELGRQRDYETFAPKEVVQWIFPQDWKLFLDDLLEEMMDLYRQDKIMVVLRDHPMGKEHVPQVDEEVRIKVLKPFPDQKVG